MKRYSFFALLSRIVLKIFFRVEVYGLGNIPEEGPVIIAPNHISFIDPLAAGAFIKREVYYMARESLFSLPVLGRLITWCNSFPVKRGDPGLKSVRAAISILKKGRVLMVFPEGQRSPDGRLGEGSPGVGMLSLVSGAPVVPVLLQGTAKALPVDAKWFRFAKVRVYYCAPLPPPPQAGRESYRAFSGKILEIIRNKQKEVENAAESASC